MIESKLYFCVYADNGIMRLGVLGDRKYSMKIFDACRSDLEDFKNSNVKSSIIVLNGALKNIVGPLVLSKH